MSRLQKLAIVCGGMPLSVGTVIYVTWRFTEWDALVPAGIYLIQIGTVLVAVGYSCLLICLLNKRSEGRHCTKFSALMIGSLLFTNFPAAAFYAWSAIDIMTRNTLEIVNDSGQVINGFVFQAPGVREELGPIPIGERTRTTFHQEGAGCFDFSVTHRGVKIADGADPSATCDGPGATFVIRLTPNGQFDIETKYKAEAD